MTNAEGYSLLADIEPAEAFACYIHSVAYSYVLAVHKKARTAKWIDASNR